MRTLAVRIALPLLLLATGAHWHHHGLDSFPRWPGNLFRMAGTDESTAARLVVGVMTGLAVSFALLGARGRFGTAIARATAVAYAFGSVASIASIVASPPTQPGGLAPLALPALGLAVALAVYSLLNRTPSSESRPATLGGAWRGIVLLAALVVSFAVAARLDFAPRSQHSAAAPDAISLDYVQWQGRSMPDTGLSRLLPMLTPMTLEGRSIVILYSPECSHCREVFEQYLAHPIADTKVIAIEIPENPGSTPLSGDALGEMPCEGCERMRLPAGNTYLIKPPTVLVVVAGRIVCATDSDFKVCLENLPPVPKNASTEVSP